MYVMSVLEYRCMYVCVHMYVDHGACASSGTTDDDVAAAASSSWSYLNHPYMKDTPKVNKSKPASKQCVCDAFFYSNGGSDLQPVQHTGNARH